MRASPSLERAAESERDAKLSTYIALTAPCSERGSKGLRWARKGSLGTAGARRFFIADWTKYTAHDQPI
eukprot:2130828-Pyramimonas_sp.AAC.1